jgi:methyl-accepting chemotaxis protein
LARDSREVDVMKKLKNSLAQRNLRNMLATFSIGTLIVLLAAAPGYCESPKTEIPLDDFDKAAVRELRSIADATAQTLNVYMNDRVTDMLIWSEVSGSLRDGLTAPEARGDANRALEKCLKISGAYEAILLLDKSGVCVASAPVGLIGQNFADNEAFKGAVNGKLTLVDFHKSAVLTSLDPKSKGWTVTIAVPVKVENDVAGVIMSFLKWSRLEELVKGITFVKTGSVFVLNKKNQTIIALSDNLYGLTPRDPKINLPKLDDAVTARLPYCVYEIPRTMTNARATSLAGLVYPEGYGNFPGLGWTVGVRMNRSESMVDGSILKMFLRGLFFR